MDVADLRKRILRALDDGRKQMSERRTAVDAAAKAYDDLLVSTVVPLARQAVSILIAAGHPFTVHTPARSVRLVADSNAQTFLEFDFDPSGQQPAVIGRVSLGRGRQGIIVEERSLGDGKSVADVTEEDVAAFLTAELPRLVMKP
jgi:hypothetical protein